MHDKQPTILYVEDNPDHAYFVSRFFEKFQIANVLHVVEDGEAALDYLFQRGDYRDPDGYPMPDLILLDLRLPKLDGLEVLRTIKTTETLLKIPVVIFSSSDAEMDVARAYECHANSYLVKPIGFEAFSKMMESLSFYWLVWNRYPWSLEMVHAEE